MAPLRSGFILEVVNDEGTFKRKKGPAKLPHSGFAVFRSDGSVSVDYTTKGGKRNIHVIILCKMYNYAVMR